MEKDIDEFLEIYAIKNYNIDLLTYENSKHLAELCKSLGIGILGVDTFELINGKTIPLSQYSIDISNDKFNYARIIDFLLPFCNKDYLFEIVIDI